jgi:hypothetical protein
MMGFSAHKSSTLIFTLKIVKIFKFRSSAVRGGSAAAAPEVRRVWLARSSGRTDQRDCAKWHPAHPTGIGRYKHTNIE